MVARADGTLTKNYQFVFAMSPERQVYLVVPFKGFGHHVSSGQQVSVESLFNQTHFQRRVAKARILEREVWSRCLNAVSVESDRGILLAKEKQSAKIDACVRY